MTPLCICYIFFLILSKEVITIYNQILYRQKQIETQIVQLKQKLTTLPKEHIVCSRNGNYQKWYASDGHTQKYISKKNRPLAEKLAYKKYLCLQLQDLENELKAIKAYLKHRAPQLITKESFLQNQSLLALISPYYKPLSQDLENWTNEPYHQNPHHPENLIHKSLSGNALRSKSEAMIDTFLYKSRIPFRYECQLILGNQILYPDFTIRHPKTGKIYYWEHFGMMDNPEYLAKATSKFQTYINHNIFPNDNLITTYESKENPLSVHVISKTIDNYFS